MIEQFKQDVNLGLSRRPKSLNSKYFYDEKGDALFVEIMRAPEYYLTRSEMEIFSEKSPELVSGIGFNPAQKFRLIELGPGNGAKTMHLLSELLKQQYTFSYIPIDISQNALNGLKRKLCQAFPNLTLNPMQGDYFNVMPTLNGTFPKVVLFLGSNLGNLNDKEAAWFLQKLAENLNSGDVLVLGLDLIKSKDIVLPAYNDAQGITRAFNLNLLERINRELGADFNTEQFIHAPEYSEQEGVAKSFLTSLKEQRVRISALDKSFTFKHGERIHTEISRKYSTTILKQISKNSGLTIVGKVMDSKKYFADFILKKK